MVCMKKDAYFLNSIHYELSSATPLIWTNLKYCHLTERYFTEENIVGKEDTTCNKLFCSFTTIFSMKRDTYSPNLSHFKLSFELDQYKTLLFERVNENNV